MSDSFLFYDLETYGIDPRRTRTAQFAAIRTDVELNPVEEPIEFLVQPALDLLPSPDATLVTKITPQRALRKGINEAEAFSRIADEMTRPGTCTLGYNSLRFDDEFIRYGLFRNFHDPYEREWRSGNSRWDLLDVLRLAHALRPDGIRWPQRDDGHPSFKLEHLARANNVRNGVAHEALSDVRALIGMARLLRNAQPKLWNYALRLRDKRQVAQLLDLEAMQPVLHISQRYPAARLCAAPVLPLARHPWIDNRVIVFDLDSEPDALLTMDADAITEHLYIRQADLPAGESRIALKQVHLNRCPALVEWQHLRDADFRRLQIDPALIQRRAGRIREARDDLSKKMRAVFIEVNHHEPSDPDASLYQGFIGAEDKRKFTQLRSTPPAQLGQTDFGFRDPRLDELLFRYRARNWPMHLNPSEYERWNAYRRARLTTDLGLSELNFDQAREQITALRAFHADDEERLVLLDQLQAWNLQIEASL